MGTEMKKKEQLKLNHQIASKGESGITLIALVVTMIVPYDKMKKCCNM